MTNNEAAKWIQLYIDLAKIDPSTGEEAHLNEDAKKTLEAMEIARDALTCNQLATNLQPCKQDDLISRQAAIDATRNAKISFTIKSDIDFANYRKEMQEIFNNILDAQEKALNDLPPAQPEKHTENTRKTHACDLIERQAAIDAHYEYCNKHPDAGFPVWSLKILEDLPSAQPEVLACGEGELIAQPEPH